MNEYYWWCFLWTAGNGSYVIFSKKYKIKLSFYMSVWLELISIPISVNSPNISCFRPLIITLSRIVSNDWVELTGKSICQLKILTLGLQHISFISTFPLRVLPWVKKCFTRCVFVYAYVSIVKEPQKIVLEISMRIIFYVHPSKSWIDMTFRDSWTCDRIDTCKSWWIMYYLVRNITIVLVIQIIIG